MRGVAWHRLILILLLFTLWELVARNGWVDPDFISPPSRIVAAMAGFIQPEIVKAARLTGTEILYAFVLSAVIGVSGGMAMGLNRTAYRICQPIVMLAFGLPKVALLPLFILVFGIGFTSTVAFGASLGLFPVLLNVTAGTRMVDRPLLNAARSMGAKPHQIFTRVVFPSALPSVITGLRLGMVQASLGVLLAELFAATTGLGFFIQLYSSGFRPAELFALFFVVAAGAIAINEGLRYLELRAGQWREHPGEV